MEFLWACCSISVGLRQDCSGVAVGLLWDCCGIVVLLHWFDSCGSIVGLLYDWFGIILGLTPAFCDIAEGMFQVVWSGSPN